MNTSNPVPVLLALVGWTLAGCSEATAPMSPTVSLSFLTRAAVTTAPGIANAVAAPADEVFSDGANTLTISQVEVVLREIELKRVEAENCDAQPDSCEEFEVGPILVDLPLNGQTAQAVDVAIDPGTYDEIEFEIHKISNDDEEDAAFRAAHPDFAGKSIRVRGSFSGSPFTYETDLDVEQEFDLSPPLEVGESSASTNVTVRIDISQWFVDGSGTLVDPGTGNKGGVNESLIKENIKQSIEAFEDEDRDGDDDEN
jgi:hypothetical protein